MKDLSSMAFGSLIISLQNVLVPINSFKDCSYLNFKVCVWYLYVCIVYGWLKAKTYLRWGKKVFLAKKLEKVYLNLRKATATQYIVKDMEKQKS